MITNEKDIASRIYREFLSLFPDHIALRLMYFRHFLRFPNLKNPKTFNEKVNWRKLYQRDPRYSEFADKITVKEKVAELIGPEHIIPTLWVGDRPEDIPFDKLEPPYVIKANHSGGRNFFVRESKDIDREEISRFLNAELNYNLYSFAYEWAYKNIKPRILIERMLVPDNGELPEDYKFFVFGGKAIYVQISFRRNGEAFLGYYSIPWKRLPIKLGYHKECEDIPPPSLLDEMVDLAEKVGSQFDFVRMDFYQFGKKVYFGEATFYPNAGLKPFYPESFDEELGKLWVIDNRNDLGSRQ